MVELLAQEKRRLLAEHGQVTRRDFDLAWKTSRATLVREHAFPHLTEQRRGWHAALEPMMLEARAAFLDEPTAFAFAAKQLTDAAAGMCLDLGPGQIPMALLAAIAHVEMPEERRGAVA